LTKQERDQKAERLVHAANAADTADEVRIINSRLYNLAEADITERLETSTVTAKDITVSNSTGKELAHLYVCSDISKSPKYMLPQMIRLAKFFVETITTPDDPLLLQLLTIVREQKDSGGHEVTATKTSKKMRRIAPNDEDESETAPSQTGPPSSILSSSSSSASAAAAADITESLPAADDFGVHFPLLCVRNAAPLVRVTYSGVGVCLFFIFVNLILYCCRVYVPKKLLLLWARVVG
jgi:hypothetical protein